MKAENLENILKSLPHKPGVYRYYALDGELLYIGKAKDLKKRVSSYFHKGRPHNQRMQLMISQIEHIEYTVVASEKESLILEANLIHNLQPKYNVLLKDDKSYVYARITADPIPGIFLVRRKYDPKSDYFGPYTRRSGIYETLRTLRTIFPYCQERTPQSKPCNYVGIKQCDGICVGRETLPDYREKIEQIKKVLMGQTEEVEGWIREKIQDAIFAQNFELAALWRDRFANLQSTIGNQKIILPQPQDLDLLTLLIGINPEGLLTGSVFLQNIRAGKIINVANFLLSGSVDDEDTYSQTAVVMLTRFLQSYTAFQSDVAETLVQVFEARDDVPKRLLLTTEDKGSLMEVTQTKIVLKNTYQINQNEIRSLQKQALENARMYFERSKLGQKLSLYEENNLFVTLVELQKRLNLQKVPQRIECYDISHISGTYVYGSMVTFLHGRPSKKMYKLFKTKEQNNDFANHQEVMRRRLQRAYDAACAVEENPELKRKYEEWQLPDLIIIDGGKGQLSATLEIFSYFNQLFIEKNMCFDVEISALAKREEEMFIPGRSDSIHLEGPARFLVQRIRDEAHRFAISNNRKARLKQASKSKLEDIPGIGKKTAQTLLTQFGSVENIVAQLDVNPELLYELVGKSTVAKLRKQYGISEY